jgi:hypothetical protein
MTVDYATKRDRQTSQRFASRPRQLHTRVPTPGPTPTPAKLQEANHVSSNIESTHKPHKSVSSVSMWTENSLQDLEESSSFEGSDGKFII